MARESRTSLREARPTTLVRHRIADQSIQFGVPSFNEGSLVIRALDSLRLAIQPLRHERPRFILVDDSETRDTVRAAEAWASAHDAELKIDHSDVRRSLKGALNRMYEMAAADILVVLAADARILPSSLVHLLLELTSEPLPEVVWGVAAPDPQFHGLKRWPSRWQLKVHQRLASMLPADTVRAEGTFYGMRRSFYGDYRYPVGSGSIHDDTELSHHVTRNRIRVRFSARALALKIPAARLEDFMMQTHRAISALGRGRRRTKVELAAGLIEAVRDPLGATAYSYARVWSALTVRRHKLSFAERWDISDSTRGGS